MEIVSETPRKALNNSGKTPCYDFENVLYLQPPTRSLIKYNKAYRKPNVKLESNTTYGLSYMKSDCTPVPRLSYGNREKILSNTGKFDFDTVYKLSYDVLNGKTRKPFFPKSCLTISGSHDMTTVHTASYTHPGYSKVKPYKPFQGNVRSTMPIDCKTTMTESYQDFGTPVKVKKPMLRKFWQTNFKSNYETTSQLSYQYVQPIFKKVVHTKDYRPLISAQIEKDTVYSSSYRIPGRYIIKETNKTCV